MRGQCLSATTIVTWILLPSSSAQDGNPTGNNFHRRALGASAILGDYLYIEGGEVSQFAYSSGSSEDFSRPFNMTLSLSLDTKWTASDVNFTEIRRGSKPSVKFNSLWPYGNKKLFQWDGEGSKKDATGARQRKFWEMSADGNGGGQWSTLDDSRNGDRYSNMVRKAQAASAVCGNVAYTIGGFSSPMTDDRVSSSQDHNVPDRNMLAYNMDRNTWTETDLGSMSPSHGVFIRGMASCVQGIGDKSLVFTSGGAISSRMTTKDGVQPIDQTNITFYDIESEKWLWQTATGDPPSGGWSQHCMVGVKSTAGSYELFVYGGYNDNEDILKEVWVLSLPGFHWTRVAQSKTPRAYHSCAVAGQRQMIVVGGLPGFPAEAWAWDEEDDWANGIGVFDLTDLKWKDEYDPDAAVYMTPESVQKWYLDGGLNDVRWSSDQVKNMFGSVTVKYKSPANPMQSGSPDNNANPGDSSSSDSSGSPESATPVGIIAGATFGGVAGLAAVAAAIFFLLRRRRRQHQQEPVPEEFKSGLPPELAPSNWPRSSVLEAGPFSGELEGSSIVCSPEQTRAYHEMSAHTEVCELDGSALLRQMDGQTS